MGKRYYKDKVYTYDDAKYKETQLKCGKRTYDRNQKFVRDYKENCGCLDCKNRFPHYQLEFDHTDGKTENVARLAGGRYSIEKLITEIKKCEVVCANCHKARTWKRLHS